MHHCTIARARAEIGPPKLRAFFGGAPQPISHRASAQTAPTTQQKRLRPPRGMLGGSAPSPWAARVAQSASSPCTSLVNVESESIKKNLCGARGEAG